MSFVQLWTRIISRSYRVVRAQIARNIAPEGLSKDRVSKILEDLFITRRAKQEDEEHSS